MKILLGNAEVNRMNTEFSIIHSLMYLTAVLIFKIILTTSVWLLTELCYSVKGHFHCSPVGKQRLTIQFITFVLLSLKILSTLQVLTLWLIGELIDVSYHSVSLTAVNTVIQLSLI